MPHPPCPHLPLLQHEAEFKEATKEPESKAPAAAGDRKGSRRQDDPDHASAPELKQQPQSQLGRSGSQGAALVSVRVEAAKQQQQQKRPAPKATATVAAAPKAKAAAKPKTAAAAAPKAAAAAASASHARSQSQSQEMARRTAHVSFVLDVAMLLIALTRACSAEQVKYKV